VVNSAGGQRNSDEKRQVDAVCLAIGIKCQQ